MEAISLVLTPIIQNLVSTAASFVADKFVAGLNVEKEAKQLQSNLESIKAVLQDAEERQAKEPLVRVWLEKLQDAAYEAEDVLETFATEAALWKKHRQARYSMYKQKAAPKIKEISERLNEISVEKEKYDFKRESDNESLDEMPQIDNMNTGLTRDVCGRESDKVKLRELLLSGEEGETSIIPIIGMGGLGKTTLAQLLYNDSEVNKHFQIKLWVIVSDSVKFDSTKILREMLKPPLGTEDVTGLSRSELKSRLETVLSKKRFLLVLDDVWTEDRREWESFLDLVKRGYRGSKVLVTSRSERVAEIIGTQDPYPLYRLPEDDCWSLFEKTAFTHSNESKKAHLEEIGRAIVGKCKGLPLAVKAMASLLCGVGDKGTWERVLGNEIWELEDRSSGNNRLNILPALKISYNRLRSDHKQCFAYCSIFPKAHVFEKEELVKIWISQGFIPSGEKETVEETGNRCFKELLSRCFFQPSILVIGQYGSAIDNGEAAITRHIEPDGRPQEIELVRYQMHDLIHDLAQSISNSHCCQVRSDELKNDNSCITTQKHRHLLLLCEDVEQAVLSIAENFENLRTLVFPSGCLRNFDQALETIFQKLKYLRMLDLSNSTLLKLPSSIGELKLLRYLDLSKNEIKQLPDSICNLYNLQTLKLLGCLWLFELPNNLGNLVYLRYLELDEMFWFKCSKLPPSVGNLTFLHNLHAFRVGRKSGYRIEELKNMAYLTGTLHISELENAVSGVEAKLSQKKSLEKLVLEWSKRDVNPQNVSDDEKLLKDLQPHSNLKELCILNYMGNSFPDWMAGGFLQKLHTMTLNGCTGCRTLFLAQISSLRVLNIKEMPELEKWSDEICMSLVKLKISCCKKLSEVPKFFCQLTDMNIKKCCSLKSLPVYTPLLQVLILVDNPVLEDVGKQTQGIIQSDGSINIRFDSPVRGDVGQVMEAVSQSDGDVGQIMEAAIQSDEGPIIQFEEGRTIIFPIVLLKVINCPKLQALRNYFAPYKLEIRGCQALSALTSQNRDLQYLVLDECGDRTLVEAISDTSSLSSLVICNISNLTTFPRRPNLQHLKALYITRCNNFVSLSGEGSLKSLSSLELLSIRECSNLEELPLELPTALKCLIIVSCSNLKALGTNGTLKSLNSLRDLYIENCPLLLSFPDDGLPASLQHLLIQNCPLLTQQCRTEDGEGPEWPKISHIPDLEIDFIRSSHLRKRKRSSEEAWYRQIFRRPGIDN